MKTDAWNIEANRTIVSSFDRISTTWDQHHGPDSPRGYEFAARIRLLRQFCVMADRPRVLDVGCGTGWHLINLADLSSAAVGIDISAGMIERADYNARCSLHRTRFQFVVGDGEMLSVEQFGLFDLVLFIGSLEHLSSPGRVLCAASSLLTRFGRIVVVMPNPLHELVAHRHLVAREASSRQSLHLSLQGLARIAATLHLQLEAIYALPYALSLLADGSERPPCKLDTIPIKVNALGAYAAVLSRHRGCIG